MSDEYTDADMPMCTLTEHDLHCRKADLPIQVCPRLVYPGLQMHL